MIPFALKGLWDFIPKAAIAVLALALGCFLIAANLKVMGLKGQVARITAERNTAIANYARCQANEVTLDAALSRQNAAVEAVRVEAARIARNAEKAASDARAVAESHRRRADRLAASRPRSCADVSDLIDGAAR